MFGIGRKANLLFDINYAWEELLKDYDENTMHKIMLNLCMY